MLVEAANAGPASRVNSDLHVARLAPASAPRVLDEPVFSARSDVDSIAYSKNGVVKGRSASGGIGKDTTTVVHESVRVGLDCDCVWFKRDSRSNLRVASASVNVINRALSVDHAWLGTVEVARSSSSVKAGVVRVGGV